MTDEQFEQLPGEARTAYLLGVAARLFGRDLVQQLYENMKPLVDDVFGQARPRHPGQAEDGADDFWGGVWKIHETD